MIFGICSSVDSLHRVVIEGEFSLRVRRLKEFLGIVTEVATSRFPFAWLFQGVHGLVEGENDFNRGREGKGLRMEEMDRPPKRGWEVDCSLLGPSSDEMLLRELGDPVKAMAFVAVNSGWCFENKLAGA